MKFANVLMDESTQSAEPKNLVPLTIGAKKLVLVGDQKQLDPVVLNERAKNHGLGLSLFEKFISVGIEPVYLGLQHNASCASRIVFKNAL